MRALAAPRNISPPFLPHALTPRCRVMASVAEDNIVQVWQMCENIYLQEDDLPDVGPPPPALFLFILKHSCRRSLPRILRATNSSCHLPPNLGTLSFTVVLQHVVAIDLVCDIGRQ